MGGYRFSEKIMLQQSQGAMSIQPKAIALWCLSGERGSRSAAKNLRHRMKDLRHRMKTGRTRSN
jgi:hypothetical protein